MNAVPLDRLRDARQSERLLLVTETTRRVAFEFEPETFPADSDIEVGAADTRRRGSVRTVPDKGNFSLWAAFAVL